MSARRSRTALRNAAARPFAVLTKKNSGRFVEFGRYGDESEARKVCKLLAWAGAVPLLRGPDGELALEGPAR